MSGLRAVPAVGVGLVMVLVAWPAVGQPDQRQMGGVGITVYENRDFRGKNATFRQDVPDLRRYGLNDKIESLEVAPGEMWEVCWDANYGGRCQVFSGFEPDLRQRGWANEISSLRRVRGGGGYPPPVYPPGRPEPPIAQVGLTLYASRDYRGANRVITGPVADLRSLGFNDQAESVRVPSREVWELCRDINFQGCIQVNSDWPDLDRHGSGRNRVSSVRPWNQGGGGGWNPGPRPPFPGYPGPGPGPGVGQLMLYSGMNYTGRAFTVNSSNSNINMSQVRSVRAYGNWYVCEDTNFRGRCTTLNVEVSNLGSFGLRRVRSARPAGGVAAPR